MGQSKKKPYEAPKIYRVELNQEQAILAGCQSGTTSLSASGAVACTAVCRRSSTTGGNSGPTLS